MDEATENILFQTLYTNISDSYPYLYYGDSWVTPLSVLLIVIILVALVGNTLVLAAVCRHYHQRYLTNLFVCNLAVADLLVTSVNMPVSLLTLIQGTWILGDAMCKITAYISAVGLIVSIHTIMHMSLYKYLTVARKHPPNKKFVRRQLMMTWLWPLFFVSSSFLGWTDFVYKKGSTQCGPAVPENVWMVTNSVVNTLFNLLIPLIIMTGCYLQIFTSVRKSVRKLSINQRRDGSLVRTMASRQRKVVSTMFIVLTCFYICWTPYILYSCTLAFAKDKHVLPSIVNPIVYLCGYFNSACNPIIYAFRLEEFRYSFKMLLRCQWAKTHATPSTAALQDRSFIASNDVVFTIEKSERVSMEPEGTKPKLAFKKSVSFSCDINPDEAIQCSGKKSSGTKTCEKIKDKSTHNHDAVKGPTESSVG